MLPGRSRAHQVVRRVAEDERGYPRSFPAYHDEPIPVGHRHVTTQPSLSAQMIEGLHLADGDHVLDVMARQAITGGCA